MNHTHRARLSKLSLGLIVALAAAPAFAQSTSAGVGGQVTGAGGAPVTGADVTIVHTESGTVSRATTDASGRYNARGLRVGGPYTITITKPGEGTRTEDNVYLALNQVGTVNATLTGDMTTLGTVTATAAGGLHEVFSATKMGTGSNVTRDVIEALPSANHNIQDYIRLDPRISQVSKADGAISAGGQNTRYNVIRIDGLSVSDPFGLEANNLPTERQPVSMAAIQEINIDLANYDTTITGGTGAVVNVVTKSGTNEFSGEVYGSYRDGDWVRENLRDIEFNGFDSEKTYGAAFGGPLVKDRLFFFANYEKNTRTAPGVSTGGTPLASGGITDADIARAQQIATGFGLPSGAFDEVGSRTELEEYALKLDWNINENHRAMLRYSNFDQVQPRFPQITNSSVSLNSFWYDQEKSFESWAGELFSDWNDVFTTEFRVSKRDYTSVRSPYAIGPQVRIRFGNDSLYLGTEQNSHTNVLETSQWSSSLAGYFYVGDHTLKFGADYEYNDIFNFYGRNLFGVYDFASLDAFESGTPTSYQLRVPSAPGSIPAEYKTQNLGVFVQDTWAATYNLTLTYGLRWDRPSWSAQQVYQPRIMELYGYDNTVTAGKSLLQPRFGFNYTFDSERPTQLRGGFGLFQGAAPNVWLSGVYSNNGRNYLEYDVNNSEGALIGALTPDVDAFNPFIPAGGPAAGRLNVDVLEPGFRQPSSWKANIAFDHELPWYGIVASAEYLYTKVNDAVYFERLDIGSPTIHGPDGRALYWNDAGLDSANASTDSRTGITSIQNGRNGVSNRADRPSDIGDVLIGRNTSSGYSSQATFALQKPFNDDNWNWSLAYTYTEANEVSPLTSSQNTSNWNNTLSYQANDAMSYNSRYAIKDRVSAIVSWQHAFFGDYKTKVSTFYEGRSGRPYSLVFFNDVNGDGAGTNDLFYVPNGPGDVLFTGGAAMEQAFFDWLDQNPHVKSYQGGTAPANAFRAKWVNSFDVRVSQELPGFFQGHRSEIALDIFNVGNLINSDWGLIDDYGFFSTQRVANYAGIDSETGKYVYDFTRPDSASIQENNNDKGNTAVSRWSMMLSFRYKF